MQYGLVAVWLVTYLALALAATPLVTALVPRVRGGPALALPLAFAVLGVVGYWVGHLSLAVAPFVAVALLVVGSVVATYRGVEVDRRATAEATAVFAAAFLFMVAIRAVDPAVHPGGGEKFLDYGLLRSLGRATVLPLEDMWFAGEPVQYYFGGHLVSSMLARLTGTHARFAYNLALAGFYGALLTAVYGLAGAISAHAGASRHRGALLGVFFVGLASNLSTAGRLVAWLLPDSVAGVLAGLAGVQMEGLAFGPSEFYYWDASRIISGTINEFPFFAWLNGDLHAHMMSQPLLVLAATLLFGYFVTPEDALPRRRLLVFGALPPVGGLLAIVNTWSFPTVGGLAVLTLLFAPADPRTLLPETVRDSVPGTEGWRVGTAVAVGAGVVALGVLWSLPFWLGTASTRSLGLLPARSALGQFVVVHGAFLLVFVAYLLAQFRPEVPDRARVGALAALLAGLALLWNAAAVLVVGPLLAVAWLVLRHPSVAGPAARTDHAATDGGDPDGDDGAGSLGPGYETVLLVAGAGLVLLVEFLFVQEEAGPGRLNTVFKVYAQVWVLWGVAAAAALARLLAKRVRFPAFVANRETLFSVGAVVLVVATGIYAPLALAEHAEGTGYGRSVENATLDSLAFVEEYHPDEAAAIQWFETEVDGRPTIASAPGRAIYQWASPISSLTGVPTLAGWNHEIGYRGSEAWNVRVRVVDAIFTGNETTQDRLLAAYDVQYVYVGPLEQEAYGLDLSVSGNDALEAVYREDGVSVYRVDQSALDA